MSTVAAVWLVGLFAGFFGLLGAAARWGCGMHDNGLACHPSGSLLGVLIVVVVVGVVTGVTVLVSGRSTRGVLAIGGMGLVALVLCWIAARSLLATA